MSTQNDSIFPLVNRRTPILERIQGRLDNGDKAGVEDVGYKLGRELGAISQMDDDIVAQETVLALRDSMVSGMAEELDMDKEEVSIEDIEEVLSAVEQSEEDAE